MVWEDKILPMFEMTTNTLHTIPGLMKHSVSGERQYEVVADSV